MFVIPECNAIPMNFNIFIFQAEFSYKLVCIFCACAVGEKSSELTVIWGDLRAFKPFLFYFNFLANKD